MYSRRLLLLQQQTQRSSRRGTTTTISCENLFFGGNGKHLSASVSTSASSWISSSLVGASPGPDGDRYRRNEERNSLKDQTIAFFLSRPSRIPVRLQYLSFSTATETPTKIEQTVEVEHTAELEDAFSKDRHTKTQTDTQINPLLVSDDDDGGDTETDITTIVRAKLTQNRPMFSRMNINELEKEVFSLESIHFQHCKKESSAETDTTVDTRVDVGAYARRQWKEFFHSTVRRLFEACAGLHSVKGARLAERVLACCIEHNKIMNTDIHTQNEHQQYDNEDYNDESLPSIEMYTAVIAAWAKADTSKGKGARRAEKILDLAEAEYILSLKRCEEALRMYNRKQQQQQNVHDNNDNDNHEHVNDTKNDKNDNYVDNDSNSERSWAPPPLAAKPDVTIYGAVLSAWANSNVIEGPINAERILREMMLGLSLVEKGEGNGLYRVGDRERVYVQPDRECFNTVINAWAKVRGGPNQDALQSVESLFADMTALYDKTGLKTLHPDKFTYCALMNTFAKCLSKSTNTVSAEFVEEVVTRAQDIHTSAYFTSYQTASSSSLFQPDTACYNAFCNVYARAGRPLVAEKLLDAMIEMDSKAKARMSGNLFDGVFDKRVGCGPNVNTYNTVIYGWTEGGGDKSGEQAERVLKRMLREGVRPDIITYNAVINAHAKSSATRNDGAQRAQDLLDRMMSASTETSSSSSSSSSVDNIVPRPTAITFGAVLNAWSKSSSPDAAIKAELLLQQMESMSMSGHKNHHDNGDRNKDLFPNERHIQPVMIAWKNRGNGPKAEEYFRRIRQPNRFLYHEVLTAWARDDHPEHVAMKAPRARRLLRNLERSDRFAQQKQKKNHKHDRQRQRQHTFMSPNVESYNLFLEACVLPRGDGSENIDPKVREEALRMALQTFDFMRRSTFTSSTATQKRTRPNGNSVSISPDASTYRIMMRVFCSCRPTTTDDDDDLREEKSRRENSLLLECCHHGFLDDGVLDEYRKSVPSSVYRASVAKLRGPRIDSIGQGQYGTSTGTSFDLDRARTKDFPEDFSRNVNV